MRTLTLQNIKDRIRDIPDFPKKGIVFKDITTVLQDPEAFRSVVDNLRDAYQNQGITHVVCVEARGFVLGSAVAYALGCGIVPVRKKGKLPYKTHGVDYQLEYGTDRLEIHQDGLTKSDRVLIVDDLLATGGTIAAVVSLVQKFGCQIAALSFFIELSFLKGRDKLKSLPIHSVIQFD